MSKKTKPPIEIEDTNGFLTIKGTNTCLGSLMHFKDRGTYDATLGKVDVSKEAADRHNELFDQCLLEGLDKNCEVGMGGSFYLTRAGKTGPYSVTTFTGKLVSDEVRVIKGRGRAAHGSRGDKVFFARNGMTFEGHTTSDMNLLNFTRKT